MAFASTYLKLTMAIIMRILLSVHAFSSHVKIFKHPVCEFSEKDTNSKMKFYFTSRDETKIKTKFLAHRINELKYQELDKIPFMDLPFMEMDSNEEEKIEKRTEIKLQKAAIDFLSIDADFILPISNEFTDNDMNRFEWSTEYEMEEINIEVESSSQPLTLKIDRHDSNVDTFLLMSNQKKVKTFCNIHDISPYENGYQSFQTLKCTCFEKIDENFESKEEDKLKLSKDNYHLNKRDENICRLHSAGPDFGAGNNYMFYYGPFTCTCFERETPENKFVKQSTRTKTTTFGAQILSESNTFDHIHPFTASREEKAQ